MKILIVNQAFHPDVVSTAQHCADLAEYLAAAGHEVAVLAGMRAYDDPATRFPPREVWKSVTVRRIFTPGFGKKAKWRRIGDIASFLLGCAWRLLWAPRYDVVIALTSPPLVAFLAALCVRMKGGKLLYWVMDLNPDQAIAAGILQPHSRRTKILEAMLRYTVASSSRIIVLDRFMREKICARGVDPRRISTVPPWSHDQAVAFDEQRRHTFRREYGLEGKFIVMYSGNHSPCHPLDTVVGAAEQLAAETDIVFCFVGGGTEHKKIAAHVHRNDCRNIVCLPYQRFINHLSGADLHVVVMGAPYVGIVHPCKIYNILVLGTPVLYVGPAESHITDLAADAARGKWFYSAPHGGTAQVVAHILRAKNLARLSISEEQATGSTFSQKILLMQLVKEIESLGRQVPFVGTERLRAADTD